MTNEEARALVQHVVDSLGEHFEAVQVLVSWPSVAGTYDCFLGSGNFYARTGMAREFMQRDQSLVAAVEMLKKQKEEEQ